MILSDETVGSEDGLLSSLSEAECDVKEWMEYIGELLNKKQKLKEVQL